MAKLSETAEKIFDDLLTLEINVIIKQNMTGRKMPDPVQALLDILSDYDIWLCNFAGKVNPPWAKFKQTDGSRLAVLSLRTSKRLLPDGGDLIEGLSGDPTFDPETTEATEEEFDQVRERAKTADDMYRLLLNDGRITGGDDGSAIILKRIYRNCDQIKPILARQPAEAPDSGTQLTRRSTDYAAIVLSSDEIIKVRKIWEVGTEVIVMQTVAQLDGDVVTRVQEARAGAASKAIQDFHRDAVGTALSHWHFLVETFVQLTTKAASFLAR